VSQSYDHRLAAQAGSWKWTIGRPVTTTLSIPILLNPAGTSARACNLGQLSPILDNYKETSYPVAVYRWHAENQPITPNHSFRVAFLGPLLAIP
jgi:uncharacterized protein (DUF608 family)